MFPRNSKFSLFYTNNCNGKPSPEMLNCDWIDAELLRRILVADKQDSGSSHVNVINFKVEAATKKGDNYASEMYRAVIQYERHGKPMKCKRILKVSSTIHRFEENQTNVYNLR